MVVDISGKEAAQVVMAISRKLPYYSTLTITLRCVGTGLYRCIAHSLLYTSFNSPPRDVLSILSSFYEYVLYVLYCIKVV